MIKFLIIVLDLFFTIPSILYKLPSCFDLASWSQFYTRILCRRATFNEQSSSDWERKLYSIRDSLTIDENRANFLRQLRHPCNDVRKVHVRNSGSRKHTKTLPKREITERDVAWRISRRRWNWPGSLNTISRRIEAPMEIRILLQQESRHACRTRRVNRTRNSDVISLHVTRTSRSSLDLLYFESRFSSAYDAAWIKSYFKKSDFASTE